MIRTTTTLVIPLILAALLAGCGGSDGNDDRDGKDAGGVSFDTAVRQARDVKAGDFPRPGARTLQQMADRLGAVDIGLATSVFTPGKNRLAFGMIDKSQTFIYGKTAVYLARSPNRKPIGPFPAPADALLVDGPFRSRGAAEARDDIAAIFEAEVDLPRPGKWYVLAMSKAQGRVFGAATQIEVGRTNPIPEPGDSPPRIKTDTRASANGNIESIDTRVPPDDMHDIDFRDVVGRKPVALLFSTPQLCESRVCGPVTDIAAQLKAKYGERMVFIHQEVYVDNEMRKGLRPPLRAFNLQTEPWLFTIDRSGKVAARLEGSFGNRAFERAIQAAL